MSTVDDLITAYSRARESQRNAIKAEMDMDMEKPRMKYEAMMRIMGTENPATKKPHSASSAESVVEFEPGYADFLLRRRDVVAHKFDTETLTDVARYRLRAAIAYLAQGDA